MCGGDTRSIHAVRAATKFETLASSTKESVQRIYATMEKRAAKIDKSTSQAIHEISPSAKISVCIVIVAESGIVEGGMSK